MRHLAAVWTVALLAAGLLAVIEAGPAAAQRLNPARNIAISSSTSNATWYFRHTDCQRAPSGTGCENAMIRALNHARAVLGQRKYRLPARFRALTPLGQLLVLVNDDRALYGLTPVLGLNARLDAAARAAARRDADPAPYGRGWRAYASNWAGGMASPLFAYYGWMYDDGLDPDGRSGNLDCSSAHRSGCWGHRDNVLLAYPAHTQAVLGVGFARRTSQGPSWTQLFQAYPDSSRIGYLPVVTDLSARRGPAAGGQTVTIRGYGFFRVARVQFGAVTAPVEHRSGTRITVTTPRHRAARVHVMVTAAGGSSRVTGATSYAYR
jgi:hypothetical protein